MQPLEFYGWYRRHFNDMPTDTTSFIIRDIMPDGRWYLKEMVLYSVEIEMTASDIEVECKFVTPYLPSEPEYHHISCVFFNTVENYANQYKVCKKYNRKRALENIVTLALSEELDINEIKEAIVNGRRKRNCKKKSYHG